MAPGIRSPYGSRIGSLCGCQPGVAALALWESETQGNKGVFAWQQHLTEWHPLADFAELRNRLDEVFRDMSNGERHGWAPSVDLVKEKDRYVLRADVPGIKPDEVKIEVEDDVLTISGEHTERKEEKEKDYVRRERHYGSFSRSMTLPKGVKPDDIEANCTDGVLEVVIPAPKHEAKRAVTIKPKTA